MAPRLYERRRKHVRRVSSAATAVHGVASTNSGAGGRAFLGALSWMIILCHAPMHSVVLALPSSKASLSWGAAISSVNSIQQGLEVADRYVWLPTDPNLPVHYQHQAVHHQARQRWASQHLNKIWQLSGKYHHQGDGDDGLIGVLQDPRFTRLVQAAAIPHSDTTEDQPQKEGAWLRTSLYALHGLMGRSTASSSDKEHAKLSLSPATMEAIVMLINRATAMVNAFTLDQACSLNWSIQGLEARLSSPLDVTPSTALEHRLTRLPFTVISCGLDWTKIVSSTGTPKGTRISQQDICQRLLGDLPFTQDVLTTREGTTVLERRRTAWLADKESNIGSLAYSGKLMPPQPLPNVIKRVFREVEERLGLTNKQNDTFFDCVLCNHYAEATAACKFHTDPEHGTVWHRTTVVVAAGVDRTFAFKPIDSSQGWTAWDPLGMESLNLVATHIPLFAGDLVVMKDNCNDDFVHAVHAGDNDQNRVSLVLKNALDRGGGRKGHGSPGQGRRSRRRNSRDAGETVMSITSSRHSKRHQKGSPHGQSRFAALSSIPRGGALLSSPSTIPAPVPSTTKWIVYVDQSKASLEKGAAATLDAFLSLAPDDGVQVKTAILPRPKGNSPWIRCVDVSKSEALEVFSVDSVDKVYRVLTKHMGLKGISRRACRCLQYKYKANGYLEAGQVSLGIEAYQKALEDATDDERQTGVLLYLRSAAYMQRAGEHRNKLKTMVQDLTNLVPLPNTLVNVLDVAYYRPTLSSSVFRRILHDAEQQDRQFRGTQYWHGLYQYALLQAAQDALRATEVLPQYADAWIRAGDILGELWKLNEAISYYEQAIELDESLGDTILPLVTRLQRRQDLLAEARSYRWSEDTLRLALDVAG